MVTPGVNVVQHSLLTRLRLFITTVPSGRRIAPSSYALATMGILDLVMTVCVLSFTEAGEANPLMAHFLSFGLAWLITAKLASLFIPLGFLEFARRRRPAFVQKASIAGIGAYAVLLLAGMAHFNTPNTDLRDLDDSLRIKLAASLREKAQRKAQTFVLQRLHTIRHFGPGAAFYNEVSEEATRPEG